MSDGGEQVMDQEGPELPLYDDGPEEDVEIEITEDDLGENLADYEDGDGEEAEPEAEEAEAEPEAEEAEAEAEPEPEERPKRRDAQRRISELARRAQEAERRAQEYETRLREEAALRQRSDFAMMTHYERNLAGQSQLIRSQLTEAMSLGDTERQIDLQTQLIKIQNDLDGVEQWRRQQQAEFERQAPPPPPQPEQPKAAPQPVLEPNTREWIQRNEWFQPNTPSFDPEMHEEATLFARRIERRYRAEGREADIGGVEYFTEIDRHIRAEFPDAFDEVTPPKKAAPPMSRNSPVTPVNRDAPPSQSPKNSKTVRLTAEHRRMAHQLAESGAIKKAGGGRMTHAEAERYYAVHLMKQNRR